MITRQICGVVLVTLVKVEIGRSIDCYWHCHRKINFVAMVTLLGDTEL